MSDPKDSSESRGLLYLLLSAFAFLTGWSLAKLRADINEEDSESVYPQNSSKETNRRPIESAIVSQVTPARTQTHRTDERKDYTPRWKKIAESVVALGTLGLLIVDIFLMCSTKKAADTGATQLELSQRPWVIPLVSIAGLLTFDADGASLMLHFKSRNTGPSPAIDVLFEPELYLSSPNKPDGFVERERLCNDVSQRNPLEVGTALMPEIDDIRDISVRVSRKEIEKDSAFVGGRFFNAVIITCITYIPIFKKDARYYTGIVYDFGRISPSNPNVFLGFMPNEDVPIQNLWLTVGVHGIAVH